MHFSTLLEALPEAPDDWTAEEPRGETTQMSMFSISNASNTYRGPDDQRIILTISDFAFNKLAYAGFTMAAAFSQETTEGYDRGITVGDDPGREEFNHEQRRGERQVLYGKRYHIEVEGRNVSPEDLDTWYRRVNKDGLPLE